MTTSTKRNIKKQQILDAAEKVFANYGFANTKMEKVASEAGISKGTVYFYYDTKENLYMALTYQAIQFLIDRFYQVLDEQRAYPGIEGSLALVHSYLQFCEKNPLYADLMLDYMTVNRTTRDGMDTNRLTAALQDSIYYRKIQDIQNIPISLITQEIKRGVEDGSILNKQQPELLYLLAWSSTIGFVKLNSAAGKRQSLLNVDVDVWRTQLLAQMRQMLLVTSFELV